MIYRLPVSLRKTLAVPMGQLFEGTPAQALPKVVDWIKSISPDIISNSQEKRTLPIICVGDVVTKSMLSHKTLEPLIKLCFIDGETQRGKEVGIQLPDDMKEISLNNPRGCISDDAIQFLKNSTKDPQRYLVKVIGEEDLLVIPAILEYEKAFVFYGQPPITDIQPSIPAGCVGIRSNPEIRKKLSHIFMQFEKVNQ